MKKRFYDGTNISSRSFFNQHNESGKILWRFDVRFIDKKKPTMLSVDDQFVPCKDGEDADLKGSIVEIPAEKVRTMS